LGATIVQPRGKGSAIRPICMPQLPSSDTSHGRGPSFDPLCAHHPVHPNRVFSRHVQIRLCREFRYWFWVLLVSAGVRRLWRRFRWPGTSAALKEIRCYGAVRAIADSTRALRSADSIPPAHRAAARSCLWRRISVALPLHPKIPFLADVADMRLFCRAGARPRQLATAHMNTLVSGRRSGRKLQYSRTTNAAHGLRGCRPPGSELRRAPAVAPPPARGDLGRHGGSHRTSHDAP